MNNILNIYPAVASISHICYLHLTFENTCAPSLAPFYVYVPFFFVICHIVSHSVSNLLASSFSL